MSDSDSNSKSVDVSVELTGKYEEIASILGSNEKEYDEIEDISTDLGVVLEIVTRTGGATKGRIADEVSGATTADFDAEAVIHVLRVLELYDLVTLDGNTWRPGPALSAAA